MSSLCFLSDMSSVDGTRAYTHDPPERNGTRRDETHHALYPTSAVDAVFESNEKQMATNPNPLFVKSEPTAVTVVEP